ncbi:putative Acyl-CoA synthetases (AMP-forming)/AMP-acid ligases II [Dinoroseobacter shibae DFL 12 = DSM 16493]|jgi:4-coumarate--CoA ligase|uniref:Putative Acyl-CoA synthetases (AMP-forming)/AMP-acid ligases II n=1 Tax=Dinoroseobacter shibae (strain DSM 16493 / NCIMB 14021 / DFL 12) TaxID=398580 RepID=A8LLJ2_DINSH|nr:AMP-binding protein [Dinoroseobacter shibae]ABV92002.1 putative Acyl-CoA synthetases (AMP-forming)/AMP-acid ligases II [Dinoroseobacter shibae DFL 12 = DSM 16493]URF46969.1 AMP-binding protein [Dinoroseobacter shibae]URF51280.1 AMP-binding protein [Dinoroseobacter shibae]
MKIYRSPFADVTVRDLSITEALFEGLARRGDAPILIDGPSGAAMTGAQLEGRIRACAGGLRARGIGPGDVVAIMAPNMPDYATAFHGAAFAGATVTTLNPTYTTEEAAHQLRDSGAQMLVTVPAFADLAAEAVQGTGVTETVMMGTTGPGSLEALFGPPLAAQVAVDLARDIVVLPYSSGTTGLPKGVMLSHRNLVVNVDQTAEIIGITVQDVTVGFLPFFHIYGMTVLMNCYLSRGAAVVTMPRFDLEQFLSLCQTHRPRQLYIAPPVALALAKHPMVDDYDLSGVEFILSGAAPLGGDVAEAVGRRLGVEMVQGYGMTEMSPVSHFTPPGQNVPGSVGPTAPSAESRIVDPETGEDAAEGEVWVRGPQIMQGYLNRPDATAETVTRDGWLKTGDLGRFDEAGNLFITDRVKELIKVSGFQVAPAELEAVLLTHPAITDAAVIGVPDDSAGERPMAFVVRSDPDLSEGAVIAHAAEHLAHYKRIARVAFVEAVPKSASGKILRRLLRAKVGEDMATGA